MNTKTFLSVLLVTLISLPLPALSLDEDTKPQINQEKPQGKSNNPKPASASVYNLGLKSYEQGDIDSAITFFKKAVELDPNFVDAYYNLGAIYKKQKNYYNAVNAFKKAIEINPKDNEAQFELANCYFEDKKYESAKEYFSSLPESFPKYNEAKQYIEKSNRYLTLENAYSATKEQLVKSSDIQAQLLVDTLEKETEKQRSKETEKVQEEPSVNQAQLLVNTLSKPTKETFTESIRTVTSNFNAPAGVVKDSKNNIYIANFTRDSIEKINPDGTREVFLEKLGIKGPLGLAIDENDNLYVANYSGDSIIKVLPDKSVSYLVSKIIRPYYLFYDSRLGKLYATVQGNNSLVEIDTNSVSKQPITSK